MQDPIVRSTRPFNAEPPLDRLPSHFVTPLSDFYVRCHGDVPVYPNTPIGSPCREGSRTGSSCR